MVVSAPPELARRPFADLRALQKYQRRPQQQKGDQHREGLVRRNQQQPRPDGAAQHRPAGQAQQQPAVAQRLMVETVTLIIRADMQVINIDLGRFGDLGVAVFHIGFACPQ